MLDYLPLVQDSHVKEGLVRKVSEIAERYAPDSRWFMSIMTQLFRLGGDLVDMAQVQTLMRLIAEQDEELQQHAVDTYLQVLAEPKQPHVLQVRGRHGFRATRRCKDKSTIGRSFCRTACWAVGHIRALGAALRIGWHGSIASTIVCG